MNSFGKIKRSKRSKMKKRSKRSKIQKRSRRSKIQKRSNKDARYHGLVGDMCPIDSSVLDNNSSQNRWERDCYENCPFESSEGDSRNGRTCYSLTNYGKFNANRVSRSSSYGDDYEYDGK